MNNSLFLKRIIPILCIFLAIQSAFLAFPNIFDPWSNQVMDQVARIKYKLLGPDDVSPNIVHVDINDSSLKQIKSNIGSQALLSLLVRKLQKLNVAAIAVDTVFPRCLEMETCTELVEAVSEAGNVYLPVVLMPISKTSDSKIPSSVFDSSWNLRANLSSQDSQMQIAYRNFNDLDEASAGLGHITGSPDSDGVFRRFPLLHRLEGRYIPSLTTRMLADYLSVKQSNIQWLDNNVLHISQATFPDGRVLDIDIPLDAKGRILLNFPGPWKDSLFHYSAADILQVEVGSETFSELLDELEQMLVIISYVTTGSRDFGPIALQNNYPLSGIHSTIANAILLQDFQQPASLIQGILISMILALVLTLIAWHFQNTNFTLLAIAILLVLVLTVFYAYVYWHIEFNLLTNSLSVVAVILWVNWQNYFIQEKKRAVMRSRFEHYLAPEVLKKVLHSPNELENRSRKFLTILFSDISGFTNWSSDKSPEVVHQTLNQYFEVMADIVFRYNGTVDKYMGDGLLVFFGDPVAMPDHPSLAVHAALEMQRAARILKKEWQANHGLPLEIRIGINSGEVIVGNMGSQKHLDYTVIGANVNLAQRLESRAPPGGILISASVAANLQPNVLLQATGKIQIKGFEEEVEVFEVLTAANV